MSHHALSPLSSGHCQQLLTAAQTYQERRVGWGKVAPHESSFLANIKRAIEVRGVISLRQEAALLDNFFRDPKTQPGADRVTAVVHAVAKARAQARKHGQPEPIGAWLVSSGGMEPPSLRPAYRNAARRAETQRSNSLAAEQEARAERAKRNNRAKKAARVFLGREWPMWFQQLVLKRMQSVLGGTHKAIVFDPVQGFTVESWADAQRICPPGFTYGVEGPTVYDPVVLARFTLDGLQPKESKPEPMEPWLITAEDLKFGVPQGREPLACQPVTSRQEPVRIW